MKLSIVILIWNSRKWIEPCLKSLLQTLGEYQVEWIVVDNASSDGSDQIVKSLIPHAYIIYNNRNMGVARARNQGIKSSTGELVLLLDDDTQVLENSINVMCEYLDQHPDCGMVGPQLVNCNGSNQANSLQLPSLSSKFVRIFNKITGNSSRNYYQEFIDSQIPFKPGYLIGACQLIRREAINSVGMLDEKIFYGPEDADYCIRLKQNGYEIICLPSVKVMHAYQRHSFRIKKIWHLWYHFKGICYFWYKYRTAKPT